MYAGKHTFPAVQRVRVVAVVTAKVGEPSVVLGGDNYGAMCSAARSREGERVVTLLEKDAEAVEDVALTDDEQAEVERKLDELRASLKA